MEDKIKKTKRKTKIFTFFIGMCMLFILVNFLCTMFPNLLASSVMYEKYGTEFIVELFYALFILVVMLLSKNHYVFTEKREKFFKSIVLGLSLLIISILSLVVNAMRIKDFDFFHLINIILLCFSIGLAEEFLCRGWVQNQFIERYAKNRKQVILSILLSSLIFGLMHLSNLLYGQTFLETILQVVQATGLGFLLGSIYYRSKNIWSVVFLHGFYDFSIMISEVGVLKDCTFAPNPSNVIIIWRTITSVMLIFIYFITSAILLRKSKINDLEEQVVLNDEEIIKDKKYKKILIIVLCVVFAIMFIPYEPKGYDDYEICYEFEKKNITYEDWINTESHLPKYEHYTISYTKNTVINNVVDGISVPETKSEEFKFDLHLDEENEFLLVIENSITKEKITLDYERIYEFEVIENDNKYIIVIHEVDENNNSIIHYSDFITKENLSNELSYLSEIKKSFKDYTVPNLTQIGYMTNRKTNYKYPYFITEYELKMIIDENNKLYLLELEMGNDY